MDRQIQAVTYERSDIFSLNLLSLVGNSLQDITMVVGPPKVGFCNIWESKVGACKTLHGVFWKHTGSNFDLGCHSKKAKLSLSVLWLNTRFQTLAWGKMAPYALRTLWNHFSQTFCSKGGREALLTCSTTLQCALRREILGQAQDNV